MHYLFAIPIGGIFLSDGSLKVSDIVIYIIYINTFLNPIDKLVNFTKHFQRGISGFERFVEVINTKPDIIDKRDDVELVSPKGEISFS